MAKYYFLLFIVFSNFQLLYGQFENIKLKWGKEYNEPRSSGLQKVINGNENGFYALRRKAPALNGKAKYIIERYNAKKNLVKAQELTLKHKGKWREFEDVIVFNRKMYLLSSFNNQAKKTNYLFCEEISSKSLTQRTNIQKIGEVPSKDGQRKGLFDHHISKDSSKILIYGSLPYQKKNAKRFSVAVFDKEWREYWSRDIVLPYSDKVFDVEDYQVDNKGNVYMLGVLYTDGARVRRRGLPTYQYVILAYRKEIDKAEEYRVMSNEKFITDLTFRITNDGDIICSGFYSNKATYSIKGSYYAKIEQQNRTLEFEKFTPFDFDFLTANMTKRQKERAEMATNRNGKRNLPELTEYNLDNLILRNDGGAVLIAEQYFMREFQDYSNTFYGSNTGEYSRWTEYYYNDIIVVNIKPDGTHQWSARIPKRQVTTNDGGYYSSYAMSITGEKLYFVFNDNEKNYGVDFTSNVANRHSFNGKYSIITLASVGTNGKVTAKPIASNKAEGIITRPKVCKQTGKNTMMIYGETNKTFKFAELVF